MLHLLVIAGLLFQSANEPVLEVRTITQDGEAAPGVIVEVFFEAPTRSGKAVAIQLTGCSERGARFFKLPRRQFYVRASLDYFAQVVAGPFAAPIGPDVHELVLVMNPVSSSSEVKITCEEAIAEYPPGRLNPPASQSTAHVSAIHSLDRTEVVGTVVYLDDSELKHLLGAVVTLFLVGEETGALKQVGQVLSGPGGDFAFKGLAPGSYQVRAVLDGFLGAEIGPLPLTASDLSWNHVPPLQVVLNAYTQY